MSEKGQWCAGCGHRVSDITSPEAAFLTTAPGVPAKGLRWFGEGPPDTGERQGKCRNIVKARFSEKVNRSELMK